eukprot:5888728-Amphidinium_carterae.1
MLPEPGLTLDHCGYSALHKSDCPAYCIAAKLQNSVGNLLWVNDLQTSARSVGLMIVTLSVRMQHLRILRQEVLQIRGRNVEVNSLALSVCKHNTLLEAMGNPSNSMASNLLIIRDNAQVTSGVLRVSKSSTWNTRRIALAAEALLLQSTGSNPRLSQMVLPDQHVSSASFDRRGERFGGSSEVQNPSCKPCTLQTYSSNLPECVVSGKKSQVLANPSPPETIHPRQAQLMQQPKQEGNRSGKGLASGGRKDVHSPRGE